MSDDAALIRNILARECDTVNEYEALAAQAQDPRIKQIILHIAEEEREHIAECFLVLEQLDPLLVVALDKARNRPANDPHPTFNLAATPSPASLPPTRASVAPSPAPPAASWTIGSLIKKP